MMIFFFLLLLVFLSHVTSETSSIIQGRGISPDYTCGRTPPGGSVVAYTCPGDAPCCSLSGFCGSTSAYCLTSSGCQAAFGICNSTVPVGTTTPDETCGFTGAGSVGYMCTVTRPCCSVK